MNMEVITKKVQCPIEAVILTLTAQEASNLRKVCRNISGYGGLRTTTDEIGNKLNHLELPEPDGVVTHVMQVERR
jgi:hypothetical protein